MNLAQSLIKARAKGLAPIIAEIKRSIPKLVAQAGRPRDERAAGHLAKSYQEEGAAGVSLVTEQVFFGGDPQEDLPAVLRAINLPLLVKDFIMDRAGVDLYAELQAKSIGHASGRRITLLLIAHRLKEKLPDLLDYVRQCGMDALVETRGIQDLCFLKDLKGRLSLVGINNKEIDNLEKGADDITVTPDLIAAYRDLLGQVLIVSQSAHRKPSDVFSSLEAGADGVLVGTAFMLSRHPACTVASFTGIKREWRSKTS